MDDSSLKEDIAEDSAVKMGKTLTIAYGAVRTRT